MSEEENLREILETNFQLSILFTRQVGERLGGRIDGVGRRMDDVGRRMDDVGRRMDDVGRQMDGLGQQIDKMAEDMRSVADEIRGDFEGLATRQTATLDVLRKMGDSSVDMRKEIEDLKRRVSDLEDHDLAS